MNRQLRAAACALGAAVASIWTTGILAGCREPAPPTAREAATDEHAHAGHEESADHDHGEENHDYGDHTDHEHGEAPEEHADEVRLTAEALAESGIRVETAKRATLAATVTAPARIAFNAEAVAHVGSTLFGRVVELPVRQGDRVRQGEVLVVVESPELGEAQSDYLQKRIMAENAVAAVDLAKNGLDRATRLYEENRGIALDELQKRELEFKAAQANAKSAEATAVAAENKLHVLGMTQPAVEALRRSGEVDPRFPLLAPLAGEVVERDVTLGELVHPERERLLVIADVERLWVLADVPEAHLAKLAPQAQAWIDAGGLDHHRHEGQVSYVAPMVDPRTRTVAVRVEVTCPDRSLKPGMFVQVEIAAGGATEGPGQIVIPQEAVQTVEGGPAVFVPVPDEANTFAKRAVTVGPAVAGRVPVLSGLAEGEAYVAAGSFLLKAELGKASAEHHH